MGKKGKLGKSRKDRFYHLAKETGYRARSAFKLIQLNRKFEFLQKSRVVIDLCAAPGGWLQVAAENTPLSSLIIGVDLVAIKPIKKVTTIQDDITTDSCKQALKKQMHTWKADCVLNDGAPNVGKNWLHDAFQQNVLTLQALKLATVFLKKGGWFVTKIFRSKDYNSLMWVFQQLFKNVHATKPQASRNESAEIFVVCQQYLAPDKLDPKFLDPKHVFKEIENEPNLAVDLLHPEKKKRQREGYPEGDYTLFHTLKVSDFLRRENYLQLLATASEVVLDDEEIKNHPSTTPEIQACLSDIKVLGKKDIQKIIKWRKKLIEEQDSGDEASASKTGQEEKKEAESEDEEAVLKKQLAELKEEERKVLKRKIRKTRKERSKLQHKMDTKMVINDQKFDIDESELFLLKKIRGRQELEEVEAGDSSLLDATAAANDEEKEEEPHFNVSYYDKEEERDYLDPRDATDEEDDSLSDISFEQPIKAEREEDEEEDDEEEGNPLLVGEPNRRMRTEAWFSKDSFAGLETEADEDVELETTEQHFKQKKSEAFTKPEKPRITSKVEMKAEMEEVDSDSAISSGGEEAEDGDTDTDSVSDSDDEHETEEMYKSNKKKNKEKKKAEKLAKQDGFEVVSAEESAKMKLNPLGLALGSALVASRKRRREVIESGYHRYMFADENLPEWFVRDEFKHQRTNLPVTKADVEEFRLKMKAVDANPIKKVAEAKARKKRKQMKKLEKVRKKAELINEAQDVTDREKWQQIKQVYKKAGLLSQKKKEIMYVVAKKGVGKRVRRPRGVKGPFRVVDKRLKKDKRGAKKAEQRKAKATGKRPKQRKGKAGQQN